MWWSKVQEKVSAMCAGDSLVLLFVLLPAAAILMGIVGLIAQMVLYGFGWGVVVDLCTFVLTLCIYLMLLFFGM